MKRVIVNVRLTTYRGIPALKVYDPNGLILKDERGIDKYLPSDLFTDFEYMKIKVKLVGVGSESTIGYSQSGLEFEDGTIIIPKGIFKLGATLKDNV